MPNTSSVRPSFGVYHGNGLTGVGRLPAFKTWFGGPPDRILDFFANDTWASLESDAAWTCETWAPPGAPPIVPTATFSLPLTVNGTPLSDVAAGQHDGSFRAVARSLALFGWRSSVVRLGWEFNGSWMPWAAGADPKSYVAAYRRVVGLLREASPDFKFDWCSSWGPNATAPDSVYPGDDVVDVIGMDVYNRYYDAADADPERRWNTLMTAEHGLNWLTVFAERHGKPISIPEWGTGETDQGTGGGDDPLFVTNMAAFLTANGAIYSSYWDINAGGYDASVSNGHHPLAGAALKLAFGPPLARPGAVPPLGIGYAPTPTSISINIVQPYDGGLVDSYRIQYREHGQDKPWLDSQAATWLGWHVIENLEPDTVYDVQVCAVNAAGSGPFSPVFTIATTAPGPALSSVGH